MGGLDYDISRFEIGKIGLHTKNREAEERDEEVRGMGVYYDVAFAYHAVIVQCVDASQDRI